MTVLAAHNILDRRLSVGLSSTSHLNDAQLKMDAFLETAQGLASDWKTAALAIALPLASARIAGVFRNSAGALRLVQWGEASVAEQGALSFLKTSFIPRLAFARSAGSLLGLGGMLAACSVDRTGSGEDAGTLPIPRSFEANGNEYSITSSPSAGTLQGFQTNLSSSDVLSVAWADLDSSNANPSAVYLRRFQSTNPEGSMIEVDRPQGSVDLLPALSTNDHDQLLVSWTNSSGQDAPSSVFARRYNADQVNGNAFQIVPAAQRNYLAQSNVILHEDGSFTVISNENTADCGVCAREYAANNVQGSVQTLSDSNVPVLASAVASAANGDWAWVALLAGQNGTRSVRYHYQSASHANNLNTTFEIGNIQTASTVRVAILPAGRALVLWETNEGLKGMVLKPDGTPLSSQLSINSQAPGGSFSVGSDAHGAFVVSWIEGGSVKASVYSSSGQSISSNLSISGSANDATDVSVAGNESGKVTFVWRRFSGGNYSLVARNYQINY